MQDSTVEVAGQTLRMLRGGTGSTLLFLHGFGGLAWSPLLERLSADYSVLATEHPGFGRSNIPDWMMGIGDLALFYLDLLKALDLRGVHLAGHAIGGWIATELAIRDTARLASLTLLAPAGIVVPGVSIADVFLANAEDMVRRQVHDPAAPEVAEWMRAELGKEIEQVLQNRAALARIGWSPRLHNPQLPYWLHRIDIPTLLVWGENDRVIPFACRRPYLETIPNIELATMPATGHALDVEHAANVASRIHAFAQGART